MVRLKNHFLIIVDYFRTPNNHAAALAYYSLFALIPIIFFSLSIFGRIIGQKNMEEIIRDFLIHQVGIKDPSSIMEFLVNTQFVKPNIWLELLSVFAILLTTSAMTSSIKRGVNDILQVPLIQRKNIDLIKEMILFRLFSIVAIVACMILIIILYFSQLFLVSWLELWISNESFVFQMTLFLIGSLVSWASYFAIFFAVYKFGQDMKLQLNQIVAAAAFSSVVLILSQFLIKYYLQHFFFFKDAGITGSLLILLTWIYYSSHVLFLGTFYLNSKKLI